MAKICFLVAWFWVGGGGGGTKGTDDQPDLSYGEFGVIVSVECLEALFDFFLAGRHRMMIKRGVGFEAGCSKNLVGRSLSLVSCRHSTPHPELVPNSLFPQSAESRARFVFLANVWSNQESKFDFLATRQCLVKIEEGQQKRKIVHTNCQPNLCAS